MFHSGGAPDSLVISTKRMNVRAWRNLCDNSDNHLSKTAFFKGFLDCARLRLPLRTASAALRSK